MQKQTNFAMAQNQINAIVSTTSGVFGGMGKAFTGNLLLNAITFNSLTEVTVYAAVSAVVGYCVKLGIDFIRNPKNPTNHE